MFHSDYTIEARYLGSKGYHLLTQNRLNIQNKTTSTLNLPTYLTAPSQGQLDSLPVTLAQINARSRYVPAFSAAGFGDADPSNPGAAIVGFMPWGSSFYNGLALQLTRRFARGLQGQAAYTWSHNLDNSTATHFSTLLSPRRPQDFRDLRNEWSDSPLDHRQRLTLSWLYESQWLNPPIGPRRTLSATGGWLVPIPQKPVS